MKTSIWQFVLAFLLALSCLSLSNTANAAQYYYYYSNDSGYYPSSYYSNYYYGDGYNYEWRFHDSSYYNYGHYRTCQWQNGNRVCWYR